MRDVNTLREEAPPPSLEPALSEQGASEQHSLRSVLGSPHKSRSSKAQPLERMGRAPGDFELPTDEAASRTALFSDRLRRAGTQRVSAALQRSIIIMMMIIITTIFTIVSCPPTLLASAPRGDARDDTRCYMI